MRKLALIVLLILLPAFAYAQGYDKSRGRPLTYDDDANVRFEVERISVGVGSFLGLMSWNKVFASIQWHGVQLPVLKQGTSTGISVEGHVANIWTEDIDDVTRVQGIEDVDFRIWSTTRVPISAVPIGALQSGTPSRMWTGTDILIHEEGKDWTGDFQARLVIGGDAGVLGPGNITFEVYMFQPNVPVAFAMFYSY